MTDEWKQILSEDTAHRAIGMARCVAERLRDPSDVEKAASIAYAQSPLPIKLGWHPADIAMGYSGLALLFGQMERCFPDEGWVVNAQDCLELAAYEYRDIGLGLFGGLSGIAMAAWSLSEGGTRYVQLLSSLDEAILHGLRELVDTVNSEPCGMPFKSYDVISGLAGITRYFLARSDRPDYYEHLIPVLAALGRLRESVGGRPRWHTPFQFVGPSLKHRQMYPHGNLNCGLAHGLPCIIAILSLASLSGVSEPETRGAIEEMADWVVAQRSDDEWGLNWPSVISIVPSNADNNDGEMVFALDNKESPAQSAWCYGSAGIAACLSLAGDALGVNSYSEVAREAMRAVVRRPPAKRGLVSPTFCHGLAGLMHTFTRFAQSNDGGEFVPAVESLCLDIEKMFEPDSLLGFRSVELHGKRVDQPGLLDGTPGVALALLAAATPVSPEWDHIFLFS